MELTPTPLISQDPTENSMCLTVFNVTVNREDVNKSPNLLHLLKVDKGVKEISKSCLRT